MSDRKFLDSIYKLGSTLVERELTAQEKLDILDKFNESSKETSFLRAIDALQLVLYVQVPIEMYSEYTILLEKTAFSIDNVKSHLEAMRAEAEKWKAENK